MYATSSIRTSARSPIYRELFLLVYYAFAKPPSVQPGSLRTCPFAGLAQSCLGEQHEAVAGQIAGPPTSETWPA